MPITTLVLIAVFVSVVLGAARDGRPRRTGWRWFSLWVVPGFLAAFATLSFAVGLLVLPFAIVAVVLAARFAAGAEMLGVLPGVGAMCLLIALLNVGEASPLTPWLLAGTALVAGGILAYAAAVARWRRPDLRSRRSPGVQT